MLAALGFAVPFGSQANADEAAEQLILATYKLHNNSSTATGCVIATEHNGTTVRYVVTAHHVLDQMSGGEMILVDREATGEGEYRRKDRSVPIRDGGAPLWRKHPHHDLAVLPLPAELEVQGLPLDSLVDREQARQVRVGDEVRAAVFPERTEANGAGFPLLRAGGVASFPTWPPEKNPLLQIDSRTWKGDSGGPVIHADARSPSKGPLLIGVVRSMRNITDTTQESRFVERRVHYPLGIAEIVSAVFARELIEQDLESRAKKQP